MNLRSILAGTFSVCALLSASNTFGAAALANGAMTSAKPTATNPVQRRMQIAADPIGITDFQFTLHYDPILIRVARNELDQPLIRAINGYTLGVRNNPTAPAFAIDDVGGFVSVRGYWGSTQQVPMFEIDVYDVVFDLKEEYFPGVPIPLDTPVIFYSVGLPAAQSLFGPDSPDRMIGGTINTDTGAVIVERIYTGGDPLNPILSNNSGPVTVFSAIPEPGALGLLVLLVPALSRRR